MCTRLYNNACECGCRLWNLEGDYEKRKRRFGEGRAGLKDTRGKKAEKGPGEKKGDKEMGR